MTSYDMQEEMFVSLMAGRRGVPLDLDRVKEERRYYILTPTGTGKWSALLDLTVVYTDAGYYDDALAACREALLNPLLKEYEAGLWFRMGQISEHKADFDAALEFYLNSLGAGSYRGESGHWQHNNTAFCYLMKKEFDKAETHAQIALDLDEEDWKLHRRRWGDPRHWNAWKNMGAVMEYTGRYREAASFYTTAIKFSRGTERAVLHLRRLLKRIPMWRPAGRNPSKIF